MIDFKMRKSLLCLHLVRVVRIHPVHFGRANLPFPKYV
jgi:hypothetical protein